MNPPARPAPAQLLLDLVADPRDPGYAAAAARRAAGAGRPRWYERTLLAAGCLLVGFTLVTAYVHTHRGEPEAAKVRQSLVDRVHSVQRTTKALADQLAGVDRQLAVERKNALSGSGLAAAGLEQVQLLAGQLAVIGPGLEVVLSELPSASPSAVPGRRVPVPGGTGNILTDRDVRSVVNQLWADGAEAMAVNGIRLLPTSAVRFAGDAVLVDLQPITPPYTIRALGDADALAVGFAASPVASRFKTLSSARGIGFRFTEREQMGLPAGAPLSSPRYAHETGNGGR